MKNEPTREELASAMGLPPHAVDDAIALLSDDDRLRLAAQVERQRASKALGNWKDSE